MVQELEDALSACECVATSQRLMSATLDALLDEHCDPISPAAALLVRRRVSDFDAIYRAARRALRHAEFACAASR